MSLHLDESASPVLSGHYLRLAFGPTEALRGVDIDIHAGEILAVMGHQDQVSPRCCTYSRAY